MHRSNYPPSHPPLLHLLRVVLSPVHSNASSCIHLPIVDAAAIRVHSGEPLLVIGLHTQRSTPSYYLSAVDMCFCWGNNSAVAVLASSVTVVLSG